MKLVTGRAKMVRTGFYNHDISLFFLHRAIVKSLNPQEVEKISNLEIATLHTGRKCPYGCSLYVILTPVHQC